MKFNIGDRVRFLNDVGGGKVVKYIDNETVAVLNQDDFEIPVLMSELILDQAPDYVNSGSPAESKASVSQGGNQTLVQNKEPEDNYEKEDDSIAVFLAFVPKNQKNKADSALTIHLINDSNYKMFANVLLQYGAYHVSHPKSMAANLKVELKTLEKDEINDIDSISLQLMFYKDKPHELKPFVSKEIKINPVKFFKESTYTENDFFYEKAHLITLIDENEKTEEYEISAEELKKAIQTKEYDNKKLNKKTEAKSSKPKEIKEVDLHIHELLDQHNEMSPQEILDFQMDHFRKEMKKAITDKIKKIVFIHGKGNGSLKSELRRELKHKYRKHQFQDASFQQYGFGATMVYINISKS